MEGGFFNEKGKAHAGRETIPPDLAQRCLRIATYMLEHHATIRQAAKAFGLSKSSVHKDMHQRLPQLSESLGRQVELLLQYNKAVRHLRGGHAKEIPGGPCGGGIRCGHAAVVYFAARTCYNAYDIPIF